MNEVCKLLRSTLELYAEGELRSSREVRRLRRHLDGCAACRMLLAARDEETRRFLAGRGAGSRDARSRRDRLLARLEAGPSAYPRVETVFPRLPSFSQAAALVLVLATVLYLVVFSKRTDEDLKTSRPFTPRAEAAHSIVARPAGDSPVPLGEIRWVLSKDLPWTEPTWHGRGRGGLRTLFYGHDVRNNDRDAMLTEEAAFSFLLRVLIDDAESSHRDLSGRAERLLLVSEDLVGLGPVRSGSGEERLTAGRAADEARSGWAPRPPPARAVFVVRGVDRLERVEVDWIRGAASPGYRLVPCGTSRPLAHRTVSPIAVPPLWRWFRGAAEEDSWCSVVSRPVPPVAPVAPVLRR